MTPTSNLRLDCRRHAWIRFLGASVALLGTIVAALAQTTGAISGTITDKATNSYLNGAEVRIAGSGLTTAAGRDGTFNLANVPAGQHTLEVSYLGRKTKTVPVTVTADGTARVAVELSESDVVMLEAITVESVREGQSRAINQQRTSNTVMNVISSDAIGNLPDNTVGDALARLAGVTVVTDGRSAFASIRGAEAKFNSVTLDGSHVSFPATDGVFSVGGLETRAVDLSTIPSDMIGSIEVFKALPADRDADAFGGQVNLVTRSAFDLPGRSINGRAEYRYNSLRKDDGMAFTFNYSDVVNQARTLGITATLSYSKEKFGQNDYEIPYFDKSIAPVDTIAGITNQAISEYDLRYRIIDKESLGGNLNFDYRPTGSPSQFFLRLFHNGSDTDTQRLRLRERGFALFTPNSTDRLASGGEARIRRLRELLVNDRNNDRIAVGGKTRVGDGTLNYEVNYGEATLDGQQSRVQFETATSALRRTMDWTVDRSDPNFPQVSLIQRGTGTNMLFVTQDMGLNQIRFTTIEGVDEDLVGRLDYDFNQKVGATPLQWKVGAKYRGKDRSLDGTMDDYVPTVGPRQNIFANAIEPRNLFGGRRATLGPFPNLSEVIANYTANPSNYVLTPGDESTIVAISRYTASEDITSGYGMATAQLGQLQAIGGLRYERTQVDYTYRPNATTRTPGSSSYDNFFPSVLLNYRFNRDVVLRGAWTNTITRPDYGDLIPYESTLDPEAVADLESGALTRIFRGNPNLRAQKSMNLDASLEWYFQPTGMLSVAVFRKDIKDFI